MKDRIFALAIVVVAIVLFLLVFVVPLPAQSLVVSQSLQVTHVITTKTLVEFEVKNGPGNIRDYVGLYVPGGKTYLDWLYLNNTKTRPAKGIKTGRVKFMVTKPGNYEFKVFSLTDNGVTTLRETKPVTVELGPGVESEGPGLIVTRRANNDSDQVSIVVEGNSGTLSAPKDKIIVVN